MAQDWETRNWEQCCRAASQISSHHSWRKSRIFNPTFYWFWVNSGSWAVIALPVQRNKRISLYWFLMSLQNRILTLFLGDSCELRDFRSLPQSTSTSKVCHVFKVSNSKIDLRCCSRNNCVNAKVVSEFTPASPEVCWNTCYLKHQLGPIAVNLQTILTTYL